MKFKQVNLISFFLIMMLSSYAQANKTYGLSEKVRLVELGNIELKAKLDTGARTSSLGATEIKLFTRDGKNWVSFKPQIKGQDLPLIEKEVSRYSNIKRRFDDIAEDEDVLHSKRAVIMLNICFDGQIYPIEINLSDRSRFDYPILIGSSALIQFGARVDPSKRYLANSKCKTLTTSTDNIE